MTTTVDAATMITKLGEFVAAAQKVVDKGFEKYEYVKAPTLAVEMGRKFARVVRVDAHGSKSVYCFVDMTNGDVLKAATYKAPAKHARGSILAANPVAGVTEHGGRYL